MIEADLVAFVLWCRLNPEEIVTNPVIARRVFYAYTRTRHPRMGHQAGMGNLPDAPECDDSPGPVPPDGDEDPETQRD